MAKESELDAMRIQLEQERHKYELSLTFLSSTLNIPGTRRCWGSSSGLTRRSPSTGRYLTLRRSGSRGGVDFESLVFCIVNCFRKNPLENGDSAPNGKKSDTESEEEGDGIFEKIKKKVEDIID